MPQRTPLTPHNSFRYKHFMANGTNFFSIWELVYMSTRLLIHHMYQLRFVASDCWTSNNY